MEPPITTVGQGAINPRVYIIILNWNGWTDTVACIESVLRQNYRNFRIVICDNESTDGSMDHILEWVRGARRRFSASASWFEATVASELAANIVPDSELFLLKTGGNLGFAGGNNVGLKFALARGDMDFAWLLNNDTVVEPRSLESLVNTMQSDPKIGICGSTLFEYSRREVVQARGATFNKWLARTKNVSAMCHAVQFDDRAILGKLDYIVGASMLVSNRFLREIGLMSEDYFLYFEELDWITRARGRYTFAYSSESIVYHKGGASTGAGAAFKSPTGQYYGTRGRVLFTLKYHAYALPTVLLAISASMLLQVLKGHLKLARVMALASADGLRRRTGSR